MKIIRLIAILLLMLPALTMAQNSVDAQKTPAVPTHIDVKERTIRDLLYFPFSCISAPMTSLESSRQEVTKAFGSCETINGCAGMHADEVFDFTYRDHLIGTCYYDWYDNRTWYHFYFSQKAKADQFYNNLVNDVQGAGIPLTKDKIYGGMSNRKKPVSIFKWVFVAPAEKVKAPGPSNIEPDAVVGMWKVEFGVYKRKLKKSN